MLRECRLFTRSFNKNKLIMMSTVTIGVCISVYVCLLGVLTSAASTRSFGDPSDIGTNPIQYEQTRHHRNLQNSPNVDGTIRSTHSRDVKHVEHYSATKSASTGNYLINELPDDKSSNSGIPGNNFFVDDEDILAYNRSKKQHTKKNADDEPKTKRLPQVLIIGVKKAGTRALLEYLRIHPNVRAPGPEPHFFDKHYKNGLKWYRDLMPETKKGQLTMEKTPSYFITKGIPQRVYKMSKKTKLIIVLRDPVTRAISDYTQLASRNPTVESFEELLFVSNTTRIIDTSWTIVKIGVYAQHLVNWLQYFPIRQIHFVSGENLIMKPAEEMRRVQDFLGLEQFITADNFTFNNTKGFPCFRKTLDTHRWRCLNEEKGRSHTKIDESVKRRLQDFYRPFNKKLYSLTGIDFGWT